MLYSEAESIVVAGTLAAEFVEYTDSTGESWWQINPFVMRKNIEIAGNQYSCDYYLTVLFRINVILDGEIKFCIALKNGGHDIKICPHGDENAVNIEVAQYINKRFSRFNIYDRKGNMLLGYQKPLTTAERTALDGKIGDECCLNHAMLSVWKNNAFSIVKNFYNAPEELENHLLFNNAMGKIRVVI